MVAAGTAAGGRQVIVVGPERAGLDGVSFVSEEPPGAGPVPALRRGLAEAISIDIALRHETTPVIEWTLTPPPRCTDWVWNPRLRASVR